MDDLISEIQIKINKYNLIQNELKPYHDRDICSVPYIGPHSASLLAEYGIRTPDDIAKFLLTKNFRFIDTCL